MEKENHTSFGFFFLKRKKNKIREGSLNALSRSPTQSQTCCSPPSLRWGITTHFCSKAAMRRESRMFSSGSQVLYLPGVWAAGVEGGTHTRQAERLAPNPPPQAYPEAPPSHLTPSYPVPPTPAAPGAAPAARRGRERAAGPPSGLHSLDGPAFPFHQVLDAPLQHTGGNRGEGRGRGE